MMSDLPASIVAVTVWAYWACVVALVVRSHLRFRTAAGAVPQTARERRMWWLWVPAIVAWQALPLVAANSSSIIGGLLPLAAAQDAMYGEAIYFARLMAAAIGVTAFVGTIPCWLGMGRNWSMAVVPRKRSRLVTTGMFGRVRHPIYALSILLMLATMAAAPSPAMLVVGLVHLWMLRDKALNEEAYLRQVHGDDYAAYCARTGRFLPRLFVPAGPSGESPRPAAEDRSERHRAA
jgi:protein-S-isoprenylcysteine O-methyltransferase Ste14